MEQCEIINERLQGFEVIDNEGFRPNVGIVLCNQNGQVFLGRRVGQNAWQLPQGGVEVDETCEEAMFRELGEEIGLHSKHVEILGCTRHWLRYRLPKRFIRKNCFPLCVGQKQIWYLLRMVCKERDLQLDCCPEPEFDSWRWVNYWDPVQEVVFFKRGVYSRALQELEPFLFSKLLRTSSILSQPSLSKA